MALTTSGISAQILSSLSTYKTGKHGTINDCKVVINHLIRKFSEPLSKEGKQAIFYSKLLKDYNGKIIAEHLLPVKEIMTDLLNLREVSISSGNIEKMEGYLSEALVIVRITQSEDDTLNSKGFQQAMPFGYRENGHIFFKDIWSRYKAAGIYENIAHSLTR